ncbi:hypothetical protein QE152_g27450 [Popillia japonica]|uniref:Uncharacterized protein n=1 Tax=Popillia japonica TaxID=7064 RepID=A0AAW1JSC8_POPJA
MASCMVKDKYDVEQFNGKDYDHWKFRMEIIMEQQEVKCCIKSGFETESDAAKKLDTKCKSILIQRIANSHLEYVKEKKKLLTMKLKESYSLEEHFMKFETITRELKSVGGKLEEVEGGGYNMSTSVNITKLV